MKADAAFSPHEVIVQNPALRAPEEILHSLGLMQVCYYGFDGEVRQGQIVVATKVIAEVDAFFRQAYEMRFPIQRVVPVAAPEYRWDAGKVLADNVSYGYDYRLIADTDKLSLHAHGLAFDINPIQNPYIRKNKGKKIVVPEGCVWNPQAPGTLTAGHPLVKLMGGFGWEWGGNWQLDSGRTDYMHFQKDVR